MDSATRLSTILDEAYRDHQITEAAQLADIAWLDAELEKLSLDKRHVWRPRIDALCQEVYTCLWGYAEVLKHAPIAADGPELEDLEGRIREFGVQASRLWTVIETEELRLVLDCPDILVRRDEPWPPDLKVLTKLVREAKAAFPDLTDQPAPEPIALASALADFARQQCSRPDTAEKAVRAAAMSVALWRCILPADPQTWSSRLGASLAALAQSHLARGEVARATTAAVEAFDLAIPEDVPPEVRGLVKSETG